MPKVDEESARLALMELADAFGSDQLDELLPIAMDGRLYHENGKSVYRFRKPIPLLNGGEIAAITMREPSAADFLKYSVGMVVSMTREGRTDVDCVMMSRRTIKAVSCLADQTQSIIERMSRKDLSDLTDIGDALGFFD